MGEVAVENPLSLVQPHKKQSLANSIPNIDSLEGVGNDDNDEYSTLKRLQRHLESGPSSVYLTIRLAKPLPHRYINLQEEYIKDEQRYTHAP
jgi:26S proteasome regulatory subunit T3